MDFSLNGDLAVLDIIDNQELKKQIEQLTYDNQRLQKTVDILRKELESVDLDAYNLTIRVLKDEIERLHKEKKIE